eukprot:Gb_10819 [translate_table: standard]
MPIPLLLLWQFSIEHPNQEEGFEILREALHLNFPQGDSHILTALLKEHYNIPANSPSVDA